MIELPGRIPIAIHPFFWLFAALIGWLSSQSLSGMFIWIGIIFFSVLIHEFGHALTAVFFKQKARIQLIALGGVTLYEGPKLKFWKQFLITLNGPLFGFALFLLATLLLQFQWPLLVFKILKLTQIANLFWTVVNLLPVQPLDGGQLLRIALEGFFGLKGFRASLLIGALISALISFYFFMMQGFLIGAFFFLFAYQSFDSWRKSRHATQEDRLDENKKLMAEGEIALQEGRVEEAKRIFEAVREKAAHSLLGRTATQYLAFLQAKEGKSEEAYELLLPMQKHLSGEGLCLLHELAAERRNHLLVASISAECYQIAQSRKMALANARAFAFLNQPKEAGGWLQTAWQFGGVDLNHILKEEDFQKLKDDPEFKQFVDPLR
jgi:Zn-dependent protease